MNMFSEYVHKNNYPALLAHLAALCFVLLGIGHLLSDFMLRLNLPVNSAMQDAAFLEVMQRPRILLGGRLLTMGQLSTGFSMAMGVLLISFGLALWQLKSTFSYGLALVTGLLIMFVSIRYFFSVPIIFMGLASLLYAVLLYLNITIRQGLK